MGDVLSRLTLQRIELLRGHILTCNIFPYGIAELYSHSNNSAYSGASKKHIFNEKFPVLRGTSTSEVKNTKKMGQYISTKFTFIFFSEKIII